jgi:hypothetical protein
VRETMTADPFSGAVYVFRSQACRPDQADLLGVCACSQSGWRTASSAGQRSKTV